MKKINWLVILFVLSILVMNSFAQPKDALRLSILYDNYVHLTGTQAEWGFSCLIEGTEKTILFDTGTSGDILRHNVRTMNVDLTKVDLIVLSHEHQDHTGGLTSVLEVNPEVTVYLPASFSTRLVRKVQQHGATVVTVDKSTQICENVFSTGEMGTQILEQSLVLTTPKGMVVITGCAHPGILNIVKQAKKMFKQEIYLVLGGFHLGQFSENDVNAIIAEMKSLDVKYVGPTHCTGDRAIECFRKAYADNCISLGTGKVLTIGEHFERIK